MLANILHVSKYFGYAQIFLDVRIHFDWKRIFCVYINILGKRQYSNDFTVSSAKFIFAISFACFLQ
jgi:hypothetical protein